MSGLTIIKFKNKEFKVTMKSFYRITYLRWLALFLCLSSVPDTQLCDTPIMSTHLLRLCLQHSSLTRANQPSDPETPRGLFSAVLGIELRTLLFLNLVSEPHPSPYNLESSETSVFRKKKVLKKCTSEDKDNHKVSACTEQSHTHKWAMCQD